MNALVLYDSKFGNTERLAEEIALALQEELSTRLWRSAGMVPARHHYIMLKRWVRQDVISQEWLGSG